jgi:hypothetical protein
MNLTLNGKMKNRTPIEAADLYVLLQREFRRRQRAECNTCFVQLPFRVDRQDELGPNWEVVMPPQCSQDCAVLLEELLTEYGHLYDLTTDGSNAY